MVVKHAHQKRAYRYLSPLLPLSLFTHFMMLMKGEIRRKNDVKEKRGKRRGRGREDVKRKRERWDAIIRDKKSGRNKKKIREENVKNEG